MEKLSKSLNKFAARLHYIIGQDNEDENVCLSPFSLFASLVVVYLGARGPTAHQIANALGLNTKSTSKSHEIAAWLWFLLTEDSSNKNELFMVNQLFIHSDIDIRMDFDQYSEAYYNTMPVSMDFIGHPTGSRRRINQWVERKTKGNIREVIKENGIRETLTMLSMSAAYFKGVWFGDFKESSIYKGEFHETTESAITVDMLYKEDLLFYGDIPDLECEVLFLPVLWKHGWLTVVLPYENTSLVALEYRLALLNWSKIFRKRVKKRHVEVHIPKFRLECNYDLRTAIAILGMRDLIEPGLTDLSAMIETPTFPFSLSEVRHKACIDISHGGTSSRPKQSTNCVNKPLKKVTFNANRPFMFFVQDGISRTVMYTGHVVKPTYSEDDDATADVAL